MARGKDFNRSVAVAVEGIDFLHLLRTQFDCDNTDTDFWLYDFFEDREDSRGLNIQKEGTKLRRWLQNFQGQARESQHFQPRTLAIIRDAEDDSVDQFRTVCSALQQVDLPRPPANGQFGSGTWLGIPGFRVGVLIIPHDASSGCLESCLLRAPKVTHAVAPSKNYLNEVEAAMCADVVLNSHLESKTQGGLSRWREKLQTRVMIAANPHDPGQKLGPSGSWLWDFSKEPLSKIFSFIQEARSRQ
jgi:hypothetical protein